MIKRPPTVWIAQSLLMIFALLWFGVLLINLLMLPRTITRGGSIAGAAVGIAIFVSFIVLLLVAFWGLAKRKIFGRWLSVVLLIVLWGFFIIAQHFPPAGPWKRYEVDNTAQMVGAAIVQACAHALFLVLILRLSFGRKVAQFFRGEIEPA